MDICKAYQEQCGSAVGWDDSLIYAGIGILHDMPILLKCKVLVCTHSKMQLCRVYKHLAAEMH